MNRDEKYFARIIFKLKIHESDGQAYEDLFISIMQYHNINFRAIKPQGQIGDRKNDGFDQVLGRYYQVYAPEVLLKNTSYAIEKLNKDFTGLYDNWYSICPIKEFFYVLNDKYNGAFPTLYEELNKLKQSYTNVSFNPLLSKDLEDIFMNLDEDKIMAVIKSSIPDPTNISIDNDIMNEVVSYLMKYNFPYNSVIPPSNPDFTEKIKFNKLGKQVDLLLNSASFQEYAVTNYFKLNSNFAKDDLREKFNQLYKDGLQYITEVDNKNDLVFFYILEKACPVKTKPFQDAVILLMSYYFEYCDIFEAPELKTI